VDEVLSGEWHCVKVKQALLFLQKKQQKDVYDSGTALVSPARAKAKKKFFAELSFKKATTYFNPTSKHSGPRAVTPEAQRKQLSPGVCRLC
jgi:hypothetical protein